MEVGVLITELPRADITAIAEKSRMIEVNSGEDLITEFRQDDLPIV